MKKTKLLIATLVCAVMLMGVGYAWWTDSITLASDITTGNMDVIWDSFSSATNCGDSEHVKDGVHTKTDKSIQFVFTNLYPGAKKAVDATVKNNSTIPVKVKNVEVTATGDALLGASIRVSGDYHRVDSTNAIISGSAGSFADVLLADLQTKLNTIFNDVQLNCNEKIVFGSYPCSPVNANGLVFTVDGPLANNSTQDKNAVITLKFNWKQFNEV